MTNYKISQPAESGWHGSPTTGGFQASAGAGEIQQARRTSKALRGGSSMPQPMQSLGRVHATGEHDAAAFVLGMTGGDPQRDLYIAATYGGKALAIGQTARGRRR